MIPADQYRTRNITVGAKQFNGTPGNAAEIVAWIEANGRHAYFTAHPVPTIVVTVPEGTMRATPSFFLVLGPTGVVRSMRADEAQAWLEQSHGPAGDVPPATSAPWMDTR